MKRREATLAHAAIWTVGGSGLVYGWMRYLCEPEDPFALVNHPWQGEALHLHVLAAPALVFVFGLLWPAHVVAKLRSGARARRRTGIGLVLLALPMVASGYLLQVATAEAWRLAWAWTHGVSSVLFLALMVLHLCLPRTR